MNIPKIYKRVVCADGFTISMQASHMTNCDPRDNAGPYSEIEMGNPNRGDSLIQRYAEEPDDPTRTIYSYVPADIVRRLIAKHGGVVAGEVPPLVGGA